jgi:hypothetical protein
VAMEPDIASVLTSYAKPVRKVEKGVPAYGLALGNFSGDGGVMGGGAGSFTSHALSFLLGALAGTLLGVRIMRR